MISLKNNVQWYILLICSFRCAASSLISDNIEQCKNELHAKKFQQELKSLQNIGKHKNLQRKKRSIASNYEDTHCLKNFETKDNAIIKTKESQANGAQYLNETKVATFEFCLRICCETPLCNVAVYDIENGNCYMFDCGTPEDFRCGFDASSMFQSAALYINRHAFEKSRYSHQENHRSELNRLNEVLGEGLGEEDEDELLREGIQSARSLMQDTQPLSRYASRRGGYDMAGNQLNSFSNSLRENDEPKFTGCRNPDLEFPCTSGDECIPIYDTCNGIPQCQDGSDEKDCPATTKRVYPTRAPQITANKVNKKENKTSGQVAKSLPGRPADVNKWGREGEKFRPGMANNPSNQAIQQQSDNNQAPVQTSFLHRGSPVGQQNIPLNPNLIPQNGMQPGQLQLPIYNQLSQQNILSPYNINSAQMGQRYDYMNQNVGNYGYGNVNPNYGYPQVNQQPGYYPVSSYSNSAADNRQIQQQQGSGLIGPNQVGDASTGSLNASQKNKNDSSTKKKSGKKNKSSKSKTAKSKLASKILSSKNGDQDTSEDNDEGRNTDAVVLDNSNVFMDTIKDTILKDLKDSDFVMETPSAAIFTLVVGMSLTFVTCIVLFCRCRSLRRKGRKRNLASDADGDYLVNGMYL